MHSSGMHDLKQASHVTTAMWVDCQMVGFLSLAIQWTMPLQLLALPGPAPCPRNTNQHRALGAHTCCISGAEPWGINLSNSNHMNMHKEVVASGHLREVLCKNCQLHMADMLSGTLPGKRILLELIKPRTICIGLFLRWWLYDSWVSEWRSTPILMGRNICSDPFQWGLEPLPNGLIWVTLGVVYCPCVKCSKSIQAISIFKPY